MSSRSPRGDPTTLFDFVKEPHPDFDECLPPAKAEVRYCPQHWLPLLEFCVTRDRGIRPDRIFGKDRPSQIKFQGRAPGSKREAYQRCRSTNELAPQQRLSPTLWMERPFSYRALAVPD